MKVYIRSELRGGNNVKGHWGFGSGGSGWENIANVWSEVCRYGLTCLWGRTR